MHIGKKARKKARRAGRRSRKLARKAEKRSLGESKNPFYKKKDKMKQHQKKEGGTAVSTGTKSTSSKLGQKKKWYDA